MFNANLLKAELIIKGISTDELAKILGINKSTLSKRINGKSEWTLSELKKVGEIHGGERLYQIVVT